jgi:hypothetical protein
MGKLVTLALDKEMLAEWPLFRELLGVLDERRKAHRRASEMPCGNLGTQYDPDWGGTRRLGTNARAVKLSSSPPLSKVLRDVIPPLACLRQSRQNKREAKITTHKSASMAESTQGDIGSSPM